MFGRSVKDELAFVENDDGVGRGQVSERMRFEQDGATPCTRGFELVEEGVFLQGIEVGRQTAAQDKLRLVEEGRGERKPGLEQRREDAEFMVRKFRKVSLVQYPFDHGSCGVF
jgi:hypothetical protein